MFIFTVYLLIQLFQQNNIIFVEPILGKVNSYNNLIINPTPIFLTHLILYYKSHMDQRKVVFSANKNKKNRDKTKKNLPEPFPDAFHY